MRMKKTKSHRQASAMKHKITKIAASKRKSEKKKSKGQHTKKLDKDPGIPNLAPFKESILNQIKENKLKIEEEKQRQKLSRQNLINKNRKLSDLEDIARDAEKRGDAFSNNTCSEDNENDSFNVSELSTGVKDSSLRAYYREFKKVVETADVILEVLDARDPMGCRAKHIEEAVIQAGVNKKVVLVLNKIDLVPKSILEQWLKYLRNYFPTIPFKSSTQAQRNNLKQSSVSIDTASNQLLSSGECLGAEALISLLKNYCRNADIKTAIRVGVIGYPNVGKSSLINSLKRARVCGVGSVPGLTKNLQEVHIDKHIKLIDCPGIVFSKESHANPSVILRNCIKVDSLPNPVAPVELILKSCQPEQLMMLYNIPAFSTSGEFLVHMAHKKGKLKKGGVADVEAVARTVLNDWNSGKISYYTVPPQQPSQLGSAQVVSQLSEEFSLSAYDGILKQMDGPSIDNCIPMTFENEGMEIETGNHDIPVATQNNPDTSLMHISVSSQKQVAKEAEKTPMFTEVEMELNPQQNKSLKRKTKQQKRLERKAAKFSVTEQIQMDEDVNMDEEEYDFKQYYGQLPNEDEEL